MPLVICLAVGTSYGGHNGNNSLDFMLQIYANSSNQIIVSGTGNEANQRHHYQGKIEALTERREIELQVGTGVEAFSIELWAELPNLIAVSVISPSGEVLPRISVIQSGMFSFRFLFEQTTVQVYNQILSKFNSAQLIFMRFFSASAWHLADCGRTGAAGRWDFPSVASDEGVPDGQCNLSGV